MASRQALSVSRHAGVDTLLRTVAHRTDRRNSRLILLALLLSCVINGETVTGALKQATWLVVAVIILVVVGLVETFLIQRRVLLYSS